MLQLQQYRLGLDPSKVTVTDHGVERNSSSEKRNTQNSLKFIVGPWPETFLLSSIQLIQVHGNLQQTERATTVF